MQPCQTWPPHHISSWRPCAPGDCRTFLPMEELKARTPGQLSNCPGFFLHKAEIRIEVLCRYVKVDCKFPEYARGPSDHIRLSPEHLARYDEHVPELSIPLIRIIICRQEATQPQRHHARGLCLGRVVISVSSPPSRPPPPLQRQGHLCLLAPRHQLGMFLCPVINGPLAITRADAHGPRSFRTGIRWSCYVSFSSACWV
jgi:hypothetical protein